MKEVKFRWIDKYLIQTTIRQKFIILATISILALAFLAFASHYELGKISGEFNKYASTQSAQQKQQIVDAALDYIPANQRDNFLSSISTQQTSSMKQVEVIINEDQKVIYIVTAGLIFLVWMATYYISTFIRGALYTTVMALERAAGGDLTNRLNFFKVPDEFSHLAISIDTLVDRQHQLVKQIIQSTDQIRNVVNEFRGNAGQGQDLAVNQRQHLDSLATAMEEMTAAVKEVSRNAEVSSMETQEANNQVTIGSRDIENTVKVIGTLATDISNASDAVNELNDNASRIDEVVTTINAISEQTNLLALNAAIEAARAGEQGRGFAVVADEVRTLAGRTQDATVEIKSMIESLQSGASALTQVMSRTVEQAEQGKSHVMKTGDDLRNISSHSDKVLDMSVQIASSAEQQSAVANEIAGNLMEIRNQSHNVEESANNAVSGCDELHATAEQLDQLLVGLKV
ncbi:chemotaxis protein [Shewanella sp. OPT22]|nr:chemotaxis protein [Shewanella sp. OPT22]